MIFHPVLIDFGKDHFSIRMKDQGEEIIIMRTDSFSFEVVKPVRSHYSKSMKKNTKILLQRSAVLSDIEKMIPHDDNHFHSVFSLYIIRSSWTNVLIQN